MADTTTATTKTTSLGRKDERAQRSTAAQGGSDRPERRTPRRPREPRARSEFDSKMLDIRRVTRVVAGGRRFSFSVTLAIGDGLGQVGVGLGKASDTALAIEKATRDAKRNLVRVPLAEGKTIPHEVSAKYAAGWVKLMPARGKGLRAGSAVRTVLELAGVRNVSAKILSRSKNPLNNAQATLHALAKLKPVRRRSVASEATRSARHKGKVEATADQA